MVVCGNYDEKDILCRDCITNRVQLHNACYKEVPQPKEEKTMELYEIAEQYLGKTRAELGLQCEETCAEFVSKCLKEAGFTESSVSCNVLFRQMKNDVTHWSEPEDWMKKNDVIFFEWDGTFKDELPLDHVGIVCDVDDSDVYYININGDDHDKVTKQSMRKRSKQIAYWLRPRYDSKEIDRIVVYLKDGTSRTFI